MLSAFGIFRAASLVRTDAAEHRFTARSFVYRKAWAFLLPDKANHVRLNKPGSIIRGIGSTPE